MNNVDLTTLPTEVREVCEAAITQARAFGLAKPHELDRIRDLEKTGFRPWVEASWATERAARRLTEAMKKKRGAK